MTFLGSGGAFTDFRVNYHNNALVDTEEGPVLIDCGYTAVQSMRELGIPRTDVRAVLFTHLHADHASPEQLVWERYYGGENGPPRCLTTEMIAPADILEPLRGALCAYLNEYTDPRGEIRLGGVDAVCRFREVRETEIGGVRFRFFRVRHVTGPDPTALDKPAYGLVIDDARTRVLWSGDTTFEPDWVRRAADDPDVATIFHECTFVPYFKGTVHTHFAQLRTLPEDVRRRITLMHYTRVPGEVDISDFAAAAKRHQVFEL